MGFIFMFLILLVISSMIFFRLSNKKSPFRLGLFFALIHFFVVLASAIFYYSQKSWESSTPLDFLVILDLPSSLLMNLSPFLPLKIDLGTFLIIIFAILGSLQYFLIGLGIGLLYKKVSRKSPAPK